MGRGCATGHCGSSSCHAWLGSRLAQEATRRDSATAVSDSASAQEFLKPANGEQFPSKKRTTMIADCHENVRKQLWAPTKATFLDRPLFMVDGDTLTITGEVEAMNGYGGFGRGVYLCTKLFTESFLERERVIVLDSGN